MFDTPFAARRRPLFGVSAALHAALLAALVVPPLFATPEPPEPETRMLPFYPVATVNIGDNRARAPVNSPRKGNEGRAMAPTTRASDQPRSGGAPLTQPKGLAELLPAPTGEQSELPFEESSGDRSEPGRPGGFGKPGTGDDAEGGGCEGCNPIPATTVGVTPPVALDTPSPSYPELARRAHVEGVVVLEAIIGADGSVRDVRVLRRGNVLLEASALEAVRRWRYRPARLGERSVAVYLSVVVTFSLR